MDAINQEASLSLIREKITKLRSENPKLSVRAIAKRVGISSGALSEVLNGKRKLSLKTAEKIAQGLLLDPSERARLFGELDCTASPLPKQQLKTPDYMELKADEFHLIAEWHHFAILNLIEIKDSKSDNVWIARRLGLALSTVDRSIARLIRLGYLKRCKQSGQLSRSTPPMRTSDGMSDVALKKFHQSLLAQCDKSLQEDSVDSRDISGMMIKMNPQKLKKAQELIRNFQDQLSSLLEDVDDKAGVYYLGTNLFPLTKNHQGDII